MQAEQHNLVQDVVTQWNSTYFLIERLLEQRWLVTAVLSDPSLTSTVIILWVLHQNSGTC